MVGSKILTSLSEQIFESIKEALRGILPPTFDMVDFNVHKGLRALKELAKERMLVVLWDEFQLLVAKGAEVICGDITEACRALTHPSAGAEIIYSSLAFGTFQLQFLTGGGQKLSARCIENHLCI
jgi:hypothetical protein